VHLPGRRIPAFFPIPPDSASGSISTSEADGLPDKASNSLQIAIIKEFKKTECFIRK
jgi:hypothetical protein